VRTQRYSPSVPSIRVLMQSHNNYTCLSHYLSIILLSIKGLSNYFDKPLLSISLFMATWKHTRLFMLFVSTLAKRGATSLRQQENDRLNR
jgi:hypothetical protein